MKFSLLIWHLLQPVKSTFKISSIFAVFLEDINFMKIEEIPCENYKLNNKNLQ